MALCPNLVLSRASGALETCRGAPLVQLLFKQGHLEGLKIQLKALGFGPFCKQGLSCRRMAVLLELLACPLVWRGGSLCVYLCICALAEMVRAREAVGRGERQWGCPALVQNVITFLCAGVVGGGQRNRLKDWARVARMK